jgi:hypothetical protein
MLLESKLSTRQLGGAYQASHLWVIVSLLLMRSRTKAIPLNTSIIQTSTVETARIAMAFRFAFGSIFEAG